MHDESKKNPRGRMIHVRLDEDTHKRLKVHAAKTSTTIQQVVEELIRKQYTKPRARNTKS